MFLTLAFSKVGRFLFSPAEGAILCQKQPFKVHVDREQTKRGVLAKSETPFKCKIELFFFVFFNWFDLFSHVIQKHNLKKSINYLSIKAKHQANWQVSASQMRWLVVFLI